MTKQQQFYNYQNHGGTMTIEEWEMDGRYDKPVNAFERFDRVIISGSYTGLGDVEGRIFDYQYSTLADTWNYDITDRAGNKFFVAEKFLTQC